LEKTEGERLAGTLTSKSRRRRGRRRPTSADPPWLASSREGGACRGERELDTVAERSSCGESTAWGGEERVERSRVSGEKKPHSFVLI